MPWLSNAIIGDSACPDASPMKRSPKTSGTPVTWQSDYLTRVAVSVAYAYQSGARSIAAGRCPAAQAAAGPERRAATRASGSSIAAKLTVRRHPASSPYSPRRHSGIQRWRPHRFSIARAGTLPFIFYPILGRKRFCEATIPRPPSVLQPAIGAFRVCLRFRKPPKFVTIYQNASGEISTRHWASHNDHAHRCLQNMLKGRETHGSRRLNAAPFIVADAHNIRP
jgi:hypothetical protein